MQAPTNPLTLPELATVLIKHHGLHEGLFDLTIEFSIAVGAVGPSAEQRLPGAMLGVSRIGLAPAQTTGPNTVDAARVNPRKTAKAKTTAAKAK